MFSGRRLESIGVIFLLVLGLTVSAICTRAQEIGVRDITGSVENEYTLSVDTGEIELPGGVKVRFWYSSDLVSSHPDNIGPGETISWDLGLSDGLMNISVYEPFVTKKWYSVEENVPIGEYTEIPIYNIPPVFINAFALVVANASLNETGPGSLSTASLNWDFEGHRDFNVTANPDAQEGQEIDVGMNFSFSISGSIVIRVSGVGEFELPIPEVSAPASPVVTETIRVAAPPSSDFSLTADTESLNFTKPFVIKLEKSTITVSSIGNFSSMVALSTAWIGSQPNGMITFLKPKTVTPPSEGSANSTLTLIAFFSARPGTYTLRISGESEGLTHSVHITVTIS